MSSVSEALYIFARKYHDTVQRGIKQTAPALRLMPVRQCLESKARWVHEYADGYAQSKNVAAGGNLATGKVNATQAEAELSLGVYTQERAVTRRAVSVGRIVGNPADNEQQLVRNLVGAQRNLLVDINVDLYVGTGTDSVSSQANIVGLRTAVGDSGDGEYAGIDRATVSSWCGVVNDSASVALADDDIFTDLADIFSNSRENANLVLAHPRTLVKVAKTFKSQVQYNVSLKDVADVRFDIPGTLSSVLIVDGVPFMADPNAPENELFYCNTNHWELRHLITETDAVMGADDDGLSPIPILIKDLPTTYDETNFAVLTDLQLCILKPSAFGRRVNIG